MINNKNNHQKEGQERLTEISKILCIGIKRLIDREQAKNSLYQLDYEPSRSLHSSDIKNNKRYEL